MGNTVPNFSIDLAGQVALVTGASSGLGYRFAKVLAKCGAKVAISARRIEKLEALADEIKNDGGECAVVPIDMVDRESIRAAVQSVESELGTIDTLINNAGVPDAQWAIKQSDELIDNEVLGSIPKLLENQDQVVINQEGGNEKLLNSRINLQNQNDTTLEVENKLAIQSYHLKENVQILSDMHDTQDLQGLLSHIVIK